MKKNKKTIKSKKSEKLNSMVNKKPANKTEAKKKNSEKLKKEKKERKEKNITNVQQSIDTLSKALLSMGGVKKEKLTDRDKDKIKKKTDELRAARKKQYEDRKLASLKRRLKRGKKSEEEIKKSLDDLQKEMVEQKRYDILMSFSPNDKTIVNTAIVENKIDVTLLSDDYLWIKNTDVHILNKLRGIPVKAVIWPYKASLKPSVESKDKKPTNNTPEVRKAAKTKRKAANLTKFEAQNIRKMMRDKLKKSCTKNLKEVMKRKFGKVSRKDVESGNFIKKVAQYEKKTHQRQ